MLQLCHCETRRHLGQRLRAKEGEIGRGGGWKERNDKEDKRVSWPVTVAAFVLLLFAAAVLLFLMVVGVPFFWSSSWTPRMWPAVAYISWRLSFENGRGWFFVNIILELCKMRSQYSHHLSLFFWMIPIPTLRNHPIERNAPTKKSEEWNSESEEYDDFGRKKKRTLAALRSYLHDRWRSTIFFWGGFPQIDICCWRFWRWHNLGNRFLRLFLHALNEEQIWCFSKLGEPRNTRFSSRIHADCAWSPHFFPTNPKSPGFSKYIL